MKSILRACCLSIGVLVLASTVLTQQRGAAPTAGNLDWPTFGGDNSRYISATGTRITAANVASLQLQQVMIDGAVDASFIYLRGAQVNGASHDTFFGTTSYGNTFALDANDGKVLWTFVPPGFDPAANRAQITNSTPVADPNRQFIYAASPDGKITKLAVADGKAQWSMSITKLPAREKMASPLSYYQGHIIVPTAGYIGDAPPYQGHIAVLDAGDGKLLSIWNSLCSDRHELLEPASCPARQSAIWGRAGVTIDPANGDLFFATGNGPYDGKTNWADALIQLDANATVMKGNYTPVNTDVLQQRDLDLGSTSPVLLGGGYIAQGGKDNQIAILSMNAIKGTESHKGGEVQVVPTPSRTQLLTAIAVAKQNGKTWLYAADRGGTAAWTFADGKLTDAWKAATGGTSPFVADGLVFVYDPGGAGMRIFEAETGKLVTTLAAGRGHWNTPIVIDGRIILPEGTGNAPRGGGGGGRGGPGGGRGGPGGGGFGGNNFAVQGGGGAGRGGAPAPGGAPGAAQAGRGGGTAPAPAAVQGVVNIWRIPK